MDQSAQRPRKKPRRRWAIGIVAGIGLLLGGSIFVSVILQGQNSPTATLQRFCDAYKQHDVQTMYSTLSTSYQKVFPLPMVRTIVDSQQGEHVDCSVSRVQQSGTTATGRLTITSTPFGHTDARPLTRFSNPTLILEQGQWKISNLGS